MTDIRMSAPIPILRIFDEALARSFYCDYLEFGVDWEHRFETGAPLYMQISRSGVALHLSEHHGDAAPFSALRIGVDRLDDFHATLAAKPYKYARPGIETMPYGMNEVRIVDPFANRLIFCAPLAIE